MKSHQHNQRSQIDAAQIDEILEQVRERKTNTKQTQQSDAPSTARSSDSELDSILYELGIGSQQKPRRQQDDRILIHVPGAAKNEPAQPPASVPPRTLQKPLKRAAPKPAAQAPVPPAPKTKQELNIGSAPKPLPAVQTPAPTHSAREPFDDGANSDPFILDLHDDDMELELPTLELPSIKAYADAQAQKQEEERRRIIEEAQREARNTIHNAAQFAMQMELTRQMAAIRDDDLSTEPSEPTYNNLFGEVDDQFRAFFSKTVIGDRAAMNEAVNGHKKQGFFRRLFHRHAVEETAPLTGEYDALIPGTPGYQPQQAFELQPADEALSEPFAQSAAAASSSAVSLSEQEARPGQSASFLQAPLIEPEAAAPEQDEPAAKALPKSEPDESSQGSDASVDVSNASAQPSESTGPIHTETVGEVHTEHHVEDTGGLKADIFTVKMKNLQSTASPLDDDLRRYHEKSLPPDIEIPLSEEEKARRSRARRLAGIPAEQSSSGFEEYSALSDAPVVAANLATMRKTRFVRMCITGAITLILFYFSMAATNAALSLPKGLSPADSAPMFLLTHFVLLAVCALIGATTMTSGYLGLVQEPTTDTFCALAVTGSLVQTVGYMLSASEYKPEKITLFTPVAALILFANALGKWMQIRNICSNFEQVSSGEEQAAAFLIKQDALTRRLCSGLDEPDPVLLVSRPTALVKGFLTQSFSARIYDAMAHPLSYILLGTGIVCGLVAGLLSKNMLMALSTAAGALCMTAPLACTLVYAVPTEFMQRYAARYRAIIPGSSAIQALGSANTVLLSACDLFPKGSVRLQAMRAFGKERIDLAILYAASLLSKHCETLKDVFLEMIEYKTDMLYAVDNVSCEAGYGFTGWVEQNRIVIGNRDMMLHYEIPVPSVDYERKLCRNGQDTPIYLAVSGKLFAVFLVNYRPNRGAARILNSLTRSGISVIVQSEDFNVSNTLVANTYRIPQSTVKVLSQPEYDALNKQTAYRSTSDGIMIHDGSCQSFLGGMRAASCAAAGEHLARNVQAGAILFSALICLLLSFYLGLSGISLGMVIIYQLAWAAITIAMPILKRP